MTFWQSRDRQKWLCPICWAFLEKIEQAGGSFSQVLDMSGSTAVVALGAEDIGRARHEAARQRWRLLADALKRGAPRDNTDSCMGVSFGLVRCLPTSEDGWYLYSAQGFEVLVCHVSSAVSPKVRNASPSNICLPLPCLPPNALGDSLGGQNTLKIYGNSAVIASNWEQNFVE